MPSTLSERDLKVIWHPYTRQKDMPPALPLVRGEGALLFDENGKAYIDATSSWWVNIHGHAHPYIAESIYRQALQLEHVIFAGYTHEPAVRLAERLLPLLPGSPGRIFYSDNGSTAVEVSLKMAIQYWWNRGVRRRRLLAFRHSYHGDTFGAMSVSERGVFTVAFQDYLFEVAFIDTPTAVNLDALQDQIRAHGPETAAFIYEPLLQGAGGMRMYEAAHLDVLLETCRSEGILCIADEVMTGFGRTGKLFASEYTEHKPDIVCLSKGITGGTMALGVTACSDAVYQAFVDDDKLKTLFHGHSFTANPITCAAALASLDLLEDPACADRRQRIHRQHLAFAERLRAIPLATNVRVLGTVLAFDVATGAGYLDNVGPLIARYSIERGIMLRPQGSNVYVLPPYCITEEQLEAIYGCIEGALGELKTR
ncbi:adenosylmethionine--8-amino-7-oxononanoate transaminase [Dinghuibacter silviterrae]|uniref:Adenosylmethionine-8-amino-7-oxononanoate aminotransferase n=1 Tax=Dinghuibacter silviterrae TaxID=1539049 RepID=A0A4R8DSE4_9BACT|nr:adenosylmethionine--8-amino-7-oxononanoate transaminase [Dinghuibacter silviterrae]TDX00768.1 adenosylmethionine-8-amino-7-oxononanoate aminotransferase [Dinghuibacter silviterrae]